MSLLHEGDHHKQLFFFFFLNVVLKQRNTTYIEQGRIIYIFQFKSANSMVFKSIKMFFLYFNITKGDN